MPFDVEAPRQTYHDDGVVFLPQALDADALRLAEAAFDWSVAHPGPAHGSPFEGTPGAFYQDLCNPDAPTDEHYRRLLADTPISRIVTSLWGDDEIWFMYEQIFLKEGGESRRTPWHQDSSYLPIDGRQIAVMWISFDPVEKQDSLVKGPLTQERR